MFLQKYPAFVHCTNLFCLCVIVITAPDLHQVRVSPLFIFSLTPACLTTGIDPQLALEHCQEMVGFFTVNNSYLRQKLLLTFWLQCQRNKSTFSVQRESTFSLIHTPSCVKTQVFLVAVKGLTKLIYYLFIYF